MGVSVSSTATPISWSTLEGAYRRMSYQPAEPSSSFIAWYYNNRPQASSVPVASVQQEQTPAQNRPSLFNRVFRYRGTGATLQSLETDE